MNSATTRPCPVCGTSFVPNPRKPNQIYCSTRCRGTAWRHRRRPSPQPTTTTTTSSPSPPVTRNASRNEVHGIANEDATRNEDANEVHAVQHCPHCRRPIVLVTLIVTQAAAHVAVPELPETTHRARQPLPTRPAPAKVNPRLR